MVKIDNFWSLVVKKRLIIEMCAYFMVYISKMNWTRTKKNVA